MLYIVTPCSRPENLDILSQSISTDCYWVIVSDKNITIPQYDNASLLLCENNGYQGNKARNFFLDNFYLNDNDWIYFLDDDNIIHPDFFHTVQYYLTSDYSIIHWGQLTRYGGPRLKPLIELNKIDTACYMVKWKYNKNTRWKETEYNADGHYAIDCSQNGPVLMLDQYLCYYNYLRPK